MNGVVHDTGPPRMNQEASTMSRSDKHRGQSLVELALVTPMLLIMLLIAADGARAFSAHIEVGNVAREGAAFASRSTGNADDDLAVRGAALGELGTAGTIFGVAPTVDVDGCVDAYGYDCVRVTVNYDFEPLFDFPGLPGEIPMSRTVEMRILG